jgi:hypothetical protein
MGYTTDFTGSFQLDKPLDHAQQAYLTRFANSRRMKRDAKKAEQLEDPLRVAVNLPIGVDAEFYVGSDEIDKKSGIWAGQSHDESVINFNTNPSTQHGLWCKWSPNDDGTAIEWNGAEKFYNYVEWLKYIIDNFLVRWGYTLNGSVEWQGEDSDIGRIVVVDNKVKVQRAKIVFEDEL